MAIINCRPLTETDDGYPLHPNMLLTLKSSLTLPPPGEFDESDVYSRKRWRRVQGMASEFWERWKKECVQSLQTRQKWVDAKPNFKIDDIVLIKDVSMPRSEWPLGKIVEAVQSQDGLVRKVKIRQGSKTAQSNRLEDHPVIERSVHKVILLHRPGSHQ